MLTLKVNDRTRSRIRGFEVTNGSENCLSDDVTPIMMPNYHLHEIQEAREKQGRNAMSSYTTVNFQRPARFGGGAM